MTATSTNPFLSFRDAVKMHVAVADQKHTLNQVAARTPGQSALGKPHEWYRTIGMRVMEGLSNGTVEVCPHLGPRRGFGPMYCVLQTHLKVQCKGCFTLRRARLNPVEDLTCDRCSVYARGLVSGALAVGPLMLIFGVCKSCATELDVASPLTEAVQ